jgi:hypothetical protein
MTIPKGRNGKDCVVTMGLGRVQDLFWKTASAATDNEENKKIFDKHELKIVVHTPDNIIMRLQHQKDAYTTKYKSKRVNEDAIHEIMNRGAADRYCPDTDSVHGRPAPGSVGRTFDLTETHIKVLELLVEEGQAMQQAMPEGTEAAEMARLLKLTDGSLYGQHFKQKFPMAFIVPFDMKLKILAYFQRKPGTCDPKNPLNCRIFAGLFKKHPDLLLRALSSTRFSEKTE